MRQVGEPMRMAPFTRMVRTRSSMAASAKINSLVSGTVISMKLEVAENEQPVTNT